MVCRSNDNVGHPAQPAGSDATRHAISAYVYGNMSKASLEASQDPKWLRKAFTDEAFLQRLSRVLPRDLVPDTEALQKWVGDPDFRHDIAFLRFCISPEMDPLMASIYKPGKFGCFRCYKPDTEISPGLTLDDFIFYLKALGLHGRYRQLMRRPTVMKALAEENEHPGSLEKYSRNPDIAEFNGLMKKAHAECQRWRMRG